MQRYPAPISVLVAKLRKAVGQFVGWFDAIKVFYPNYPELEGKERIVKCMIVMDVTGHLNQLNAYCLFYTQLWISVRVS